MKRIILLVLALALLALPALSEGNRLLEADGGQYLRALIVCGDQLVLAGDDSLFTWREGEAGFTAWTPDLRLENPYRQDEVAGLYDLALFDDAGTLRGLRLLRDGDYAFRAMQLFDLAFTDAGVVTAENPVELPLPGEIEAMDWFDLRKVVCREGVLYALGEGEDVLLCVIDPARPSSAAVTPLRSWDNALTVGPDGVLLATGTNDGDGRLSLCRVGADGSLEAICRLEAEASTVAADPETGAVYAAMNGQACPVDLSTGELGEPFAALTLGGECAAVLPGGRWYAVAMAGGVAVLDTRGHLDGDSVLRISTTQGDEWLNRAVMRFAVEHPEVTPVLGYDAGDPLEGMMTQSGDGPGLRRQLSGAAGAGLHAAAGRQRSHPRAGRARLSRHTALHQPGRRAGGATRVGLGRLHGHQRRAAGEAGPLDGGRAGQLVGLPGLHGGAAAAPAGPAGRARQLCL